jgi:hypothetical protein
MSDHTDQSGSSHLQVFFEAALRDFETQMDVAFAKHPLVELLKNCKTVESVAVVLRDQIPASSEFRGNDKIMKPLITILSVLHDLSAAGKIDQDIGLVRP